ncbi:MAG: hypothetical protein IKO40_07810 [Kiritimatiellae bacterium]|nr:hypothetical protein [Kiritimatiellia bacterium]
MKRRNALWLALIAVILVSGVLVVWLAYHRSELLAAMELRSGAQFEDVVRAVAVQTNVPVSSAEEQNDRRELGELRRKLEEAQNAVRRLTQSRSIAQKSLEDLEKLYFPPEEPSLEEFRETQPEEYEAMKKSLAHEMRYMAAKKRLREEYLARLDLSVLTEEERQTLLEVMRHVAEEEDMLLSGKIEPEVYEQDGRYTVFNQLLSISQLSYSQLQKWLRENEAKSLALAADWEQVGGSEHFTPILRGWSKVYQGLFCLEVVSPQYICGETIVMISDPDAPEGKRPISVKVEPGWQP